MRLLNNKNTELLATPDSRYGLNCGIAVAGVVAMILPVCAPPAIIYGLALASYYILPAMLPAGTDYSSWMLIPIAIPIAAILMTGYFIVGRVYILWFSRLGFGAREEMLEPLFRAFAISFGPIAALLLYFALSTTPTYAGIILSAMCFAGGVGFSLLGIKHQMRILEESLPDHDIHAELECDTSSGEFKDRLFALKEAKNSEQLQQLSKQCLILLKPAAATSMDCTSILIDELMKNKLHMEADELSSLQLRLIEQKTS